MRRNAPPQRGTALVQQRMESWLADSCVGVLVLTNTQEGLLAVIAPPLKFPLDFATQPPRREGCPVTFVTDNVAARKLSIATAIVFHHAGTR